MNTGHWSIEMDLEKLFEDGYNPDEEYLGRDKDVNYVEPLVSVCSTTYQHANYLEDCIEGILMQKTDFPVEIIIGEDESTDGTREICKKYAVEHPDKIRLFLRDRNTSSVYNVNGKRIFGFNGKWTRKSARGKYIAMCEGDDYWTDPLKLQKQVDFMESNPGTALTYHKHKNVDQRGELIDYRNKPLPCTMMMVNDFDDMPVGLDCPNGDRLLLTYLSLKGSLKYLEDIEPSVRRHHEGGVMSMASEKEKLNRQVRTWSSIYEAFKDTKLSDKLYAKKNLFTYRQMLYDWKAGDKHLLNVLLFPLEVRSLKLYKQFIRINN